MDDRKPRADTALVHPDGRVQALWDACPWLANEPDLEEGPYYVFGVVALRVIDRGFSTEEEDLIFAHFNAMALDDADTQNVLIAGALEMLCDPGATAIARAKLKGRALLYFERVFRGLPFSKTPQAGRDE